MLSANKQYLDLSSVQFDGSHTPAKRVGEAVGYQGRKASKTSHSLYLSDDTGQMSAVGRPQSGQHKDLYEIASIFKEMLDVLQQADINREGIFPNADPGFYSEEVKQLCEQNQTELNVKTNKRNRKQGTDEYNTLTMNFTNQELKLSMRMRGLMPSKPYWFHMKRKYLPQNFLEIRLHPPFKDNA